MNESHEEKRVVHVDDRFGFRFIEYGTDHDFELGPGARIFSNSIFMVSMLVVLLVVTFGFVTHVSVKAPISGQILPERIHKIFPEISGRVTEVRIKPGDQVAAGDTLAVLRIEDYEKSAADLEFGKSQAEDELARLREDFADRVSRANSALRKARVRLDGATKKHGDTQRLVVGGIVAANQLETAARELRIAQIDHDDLQQQLRKLRAQASIQTGSAEDKVRDLDRQILRVQTEVGRSAVRADSAGVVLDVPINIGQSVSSQTLVAEVANIGRLVFVAMVPEFHRKRIEVGQPANLKFPSYKDYEFRGTVLRVSPRAKFIENRSMYEVRLDVALPEKLHTLRAGDEIQLRPGMTATGNVFVDRMRAIKYVVVVKMLKRG